MSRRTVSPRPAAARREPRATGTGKHRILVACALPAEARALEPDAEVRIVGPGVRDGGLLERALAGGCFDVLISWGVAGALRPELSVGDLVVPRWVVDERGQRWDCEPEALGLRVTGARTLVTTAEPVLSPLQRIALRSKSGADVVDMESAELAARCLAHGVRFVCVRAISDAAHMNLPQWVRGVMDESGQVRAGYLLGALLKDPASLSRLVGMARGMAAALRTLRDFAEARGLTRDRAA